jgi:hypothetical protein
MLINNIKKRARGRPRKDSEAIMVRVPAELLADIDSHIRESESSIGRPEAIRQLIKLGFKHKPPPHWTQDGLSRFFEWAYISRWATHFRKKKEFKLLASIDQCFVDLFEASEWRNPKGLVETGLLARASSSFKAACENATAGQVAEAYPQLRACLENAAYSAHMRQNPGHDIIWSKRSENRNKSRKAFISADVSKSVMKTSEKLGKTYDQLYQLTIDYGAHPNEAALYGSMKMLKPTTGGTRMEIGQLQGHGVGMDFALKTTAEVGFCVLKIFEVIFPERFIAVGVSERIKKWPV